MSRQKSHLLGDKQISSVGIFDVVAFYTLFRVHLTLIIVCLCPKKVLNRSFSGFLCLDGKYAEIGTFGRILGQTGSNGTQRVKNQAMEQAKTKFSKSTSWRSTSDGVASYNQTPSKFLFEGSTSDSPYDAVTRIYQTPSRPITKPQILEAYTLRRCRSL